MSNLCKWLHENLEQLPTIEYPIKLENLPYNGIYFFYEKDEILGHGKNNQRIVRIGTHKGCNFRNRIKEHYLCNESKMNFNKDTPKPSDRSIFRKNIGRALLYKDKDDYLDTWEIDFIKRDNRDNFGNKRNIEKEKILESKITEIFRNRFSFRFIIIDEQMKRMGSKGLESSLIGTVASCSECKPSNIWLGNHSNKKQIRDSGLWLVQHLKDNGIKENDKETILNAIKKTNEWEANKSK